MTILGGRMRSRSTECCLFVCSGRKRVVMLSQTSKNSEPVQ